MLLRHVASWLTIMQLYHSSAARHHTTLSTILAMMVLYNNKKNLAFLYHHALYAVQCFIRHITLRVIT